MGAIYDIIQRHTEVLATANHVLLESEIMDYENIAEMMLEPLEFVQAQWTNREEKSAHLVLIARLFSGFEATKLLLLNGLLDHSHMPLRDTIECTLLLRLFEARPDLTSPWMNKLIPLGAGKAKSELEKMGLDVSEYALWEVESAVAHANFLGSMSRVNDTKIDDASFNREIRFGGHRNDRQLKALFRSLISLMMLAVAGPLTEAYIPYVAEEYGRAWLTRLGETAARLDELHRIYVQEGKTRASDPPSELQKQIDSLIRARLHMNQLKGYRDRK